MNDPKHWSESDLASLVQGYTDGWEVVHSEPYGRSRWHDRMMTVVKSGNITLGVNWCRGLTECQEDMYDYQPTPVESYEVEVPATMATKWRKLPEGGTTGEDGGSTG